MSVICYQNRKVLLTLEVQNLDQQLTGDTLSALVKEYHSQISPRSQDFNTMQFFSLSYKV